MKRFYLRAFVISSMALLAGLSNVMAAGISVSEDRAEFVLTQETFPYSGGTLANLQSDSHNIELVTQTELKHFYTGAYTDWLEGNSYAISGDENFDVIFSAPQTVFAIDYSDHSVESTFTLTFYYDTVDVGSTSFTNRQFEVAKFIGFVSDTPFNKVEIREASEVNSNEYFQFYMAEVARVNVAPTAVAGPYQSIRPGDTVMLDGSNSFDDNTESGLLGYRWKFYRIPAGSAATLIDADTATPWFETDVTGVYYVQLWVTDEDGLTSPRNIVKIITSGNLEPTAAAGGDQMVVIGEAVTLDGSGSTDPENDSLTYAWTLLSPEGSNSSIADDTLIASTFIPYVAGIYEVSLVVSDLIGPGAPDTAQITAISAGEFGELQILSASDVITALGAHQVTTGGNQNSLLQHLIQAVDSIQVGEPTKAVKKLEDALERTDGCILRGSADGNGKGRDWITDCDAQIDAYNLLSAALGALAP